jgi:hypothetical protein
MSPVAKISWSIIVLGIAVAALAAQIIPVRQAAIQQAQYTANTGELVRDVLIGQSFTATADNLSAVSVMFATYSGRGNTEEVRFHLRRSVDDTEDLRWAAASPHDFGDNQMYRFEFEPIRDSKGQQYFFFVVSPDSVPGNAVTVDIDARDPYHLGSAYIVRGQGSAVTASDVLRRSGKQTVDLAFTTYHTVPLRAAVVTNINQAYRTFVSTWDERRSAYLIWAKVTLPALVFLLVVILVQQSIYPKAVGKVGKRRLTMAILSLLFVAAVVLRLIYAIELPLTNDEGNYVYDARSLRQGTLAGGDGYVKAVVVILWVALWQSLLGDTILAGRLSSVVIGSLTIYPLYFLAKDLWSSRAVTKTWLASYLNKQKVEQPASQVGWGRRVGLVAAAIWALFGVANVFGIYVHTQPVALFFGISGISILLMALRGTTPRLSFLSTAKAPSATSWFVLAGLLLGLAVASRKSMLALGLVPLAFVLLEGRSLRLRFRHLVAVGVGFLLVVSLVAGLAYWIYGAEGLWEALGFNSAEDGIFSTDPAEEENARAYSLRGMTPFFRESLPLILLSLIGLGVVFEQFVRSLFRKIGNAPSRPATMLSDHFIPKLGWIFPWLVFWWAWGFFFEYEGEPFMRYGIRWLWYLYAVVLVLLTVSPRPRSERIRWPEQLPPVVASSTQPGRVGQQAVDVKQQTEQEMGVRWHLTAALFAPLWIAGLSLFYTNWIKFHANYIAEFIPPLVILAAFGAIALYRRLKAGVFLAKDYPMIEILRRLLVLGITAVVIWSVVVSNYITFLFEHTGTFQQGAAQEAAQWAQDHIPLEEPIFTGAALIPYLSGHHTALDIAHPRWYAYEFTRKDTERLNTFLPPAAEMVQAFRQANWFLLEQQTSFSFLMEYEEIEAALEEDFVSVKGISNGSNTLTFYRRMRR